MSDDKFPASQGPPTPTLEGLIFDARKLHKAVDEAIPVEQWSDDMKVAMPCLAYTISKFDKLRVDND